MEISDLRTPSFPEGSVTLRFYCILGVFCGVKYKQKCVRSTTSKENTSTREENSALSIKGPIYEELELEDKTATIDLSQNIAYECVKKT